MTYQVVKTYGHNKGLSSAFRQPLAKSHCRFIHGYALAFEVTFESKTLDANNWVIDFGSLKPLKAFLSESFDHKTIICESDPFLKDFKTLHEKGLIDLRVTKTVGCEGFAAEVGEWIVGNISDLVKSVKVMEHSGNAAVWINSKHVA